MLLITYCISKENSIALHSYLFVHNYPYKLTFLKTYLYSRKAMLFVLVLFVVALLVLAFGFYKFSNNTKSGAKVVRPAEWGLATSLPDHVILTISSDPATTQSVTWRTDTTVTKAVAEIALADAAPRFGKQAQLYQAQTDLLDATFIETAQTKARYHSVTFTDLLPATTYAYRVGDGTQWSEWFQFRTADKLHQPFSFIYMGDAQNNILENFSRVVRESYKKAPDARFIVHAGDLVHGAHNEKLWHEWFIAGGWIYGSIPNIPAPGNHEYGGYTQNEHKAKNRKFSKQWHHQFTLPQNGPESLKEMAYYFDYQGTRFITLNSNEKIKEQTQWLDTLLKNNTQKWTIVTFHHPIFSAANHDDNKEIRTLWQPLFNKYNIDLVLTGHEHTYTRGQAKFDNLVDGPVYVVSIGGSNMYYFKEKPWANYNAVLQRKGENTQLFQVVTVDSNKIEFRSYMASGMLYDAFDLVKKENKQRARLVEHKELLKAERTHANTIPYKDKKKD